MGVKNRQYTKLSELGRMVGIGTRLDGGDNNGGIIIDKNYSTEEMAKVVNKMQAHLKSVEKSAQPEDNKSNQEQIEMFDSTKPKQEIEKEPPQEEENDERSDGTSDNESDTDSSVEEKIPSASSELKTVSLDDDNN